MLSPALLSAFRRFQPLLSSFRKSHKKQNGPSSSLSVRSFSVALTVCLLTTSTPAAPQTVVAVANESALSFYLWFNNSGLRKLIQGRPIAGAKKQEKQSETILRYTKHEIG